MGLLSVCVLSANRLYGFLAQLSRTITWQGCSMDQSSDRSIYILGRRADFSVAEMAGTELYHLD